MKTRLLTALLSAGSVLAVAQRPERPFAMGSELQLGYTRHTFKMRDLQASPMFYVANLNGVQVGYTRQTARHQWQAHLQAGLGELIAPGLGIRSFNFTPDQELPLWLAPTLYRGQLELAYRRRVGQAGNRTTWLGVGLHETVAYADGLALNTWAFNRAALQLLYQLRLPVGRRHVIVADAALPVLAAVSRMPYSNVVSEPNRSEVSTFFGGTRWATLNRYVSPELGVTYRFALSSHVGFSAGYRYAYLYYPDPRLIRTADHAFSAAIRYAFQPKFR